ncbi:phage head spike fiber domain-containing protein [Thiothrix lacustris]|uniref:phage head spike fiber domain-containing protein n=1 Tax=Thiothrix lacustris TaxID=525917 RepID=UPI00048E427E|nr:hypothetical protein [Thiothrix lacustris]
MNQSEWLTNPVHDHCRAWLVELTAQHIKTGEQKTFFFSTQWHQAFADYLPWMETIPVISNVLGGSDTAVTEITVPSGFEGFIDYDFYGQSIRISMTDVRGTPYPTYMVIHFGLISNATNEGGTSLKLESKPAGLFRLENTALNDFYINDAIVQYPVSVGKPCNVPALYVGQSGTAHIYRVNDAAITSVTAWINGVAQAVGDNGLFATGQFSLGTKADVLCDFTCVGRITLQQAVTALGTNAGTSAPLLLFYSLFANCANTTVAMHWPASSGATALDAVKALAAVGHAYIAENGSSFALTQLQSVLSVRDNGINCDTIPPGYEVPEPTFSLSTVIPVATIHDGHIVRDSLQVFGLIKKLDPVFVKAGEFANRYNNRPALAITGDSYRNLFKYSSNTLAANNAVVVNLAYSSCPSGANPEDELYRELKYWASRMAETRYRYRFVMGVNAFLSYLRPGSPVLLDFAALGGKRYASVTRVIRAGGGGFLSEVEVIVDNTLVCDESSYCNNVFDDVFNYAAGNAAGVTGCSFSMNTGGTPIPNAGAADRLIEDSATNVHYAFKNIGASTTPITFGGFFKRAGRDVRLAYVSAGSAEGLWADFDLARGKVDGSGVHGTSGSVTASITPCNGGFYRCEISGIAPASAIYTTVGLRNLGVAANGNQPTYLGAGVSGIEMYAVYANR